MYPLSKFEFIDFHTHIHGYEGLALETAIKEIEEAQILSLACSIDQSSFEKSKKIALNHPLIIPTFGIHPFQAHEFTNFENLESLMNESFIIGEIGLDKFWAKNDFSLQVKIFELFLDHCDSLGKYCVIHTKGAEKEVREILLNFPKAKPIIHWYNGPIEIVHEFWNRGYPCTIGLEVHYSEFIQKLATEIPAPLLLTETDNPGSEPWLGGSSDSPLLIKRVVDDIAQCRGLTQIQLTKLVSENALAILKN